MTRWTDPSELTPKERLEEVAAILAGAVLRLKRRSALPVPESPQKEAESAPERPRIPQKDLIYGPFHGSHVDTTVIPRKPHEEHSGA
jgi:hypothetical protein